MGAQEHFVISQAGRQPQPGRDRRRVRRPFGSRLGDAALAAAAGAARGRGLLAGGARRRWPRRRRRSTVLDGRFRLVATRPALIDRLHRATAALRPPALVVLAGLLLAMLAMLAADVPALVDGIGELLRQPAALVAVACCCG